METSACFIRMINMMYTCVSANFIFVGKNTKNQIKGCAPGNIAFVLDGIVPSASREIVLPAKAKPDQLIAIGLRIHSLCVPYQEIYVVRKGHVVLFREYPAVRFVLGNTSCHYSFMRSVRLRIEPNRRHHVVALSKTH